MKLIRHSLGVSGFLIFVSVIFVPSVVYADTVVGGVIRGNNSWTKAGSPYYIKSDITIPDGSSLSVGPGVHITVASSSDSGNSWGNPSIFVSGGYMELVGSDTERVDLSKINGLFISGSAFGHGSSTIRNTDISGGTSLAFDHASGTISYSSVTGADIGLWLKDSRVSVRSSKFIGNDTGIYIDSISLQPAFSMSEVSTSSPVGLNTSSAIYINNSDISSNHTSAIFNSSNNLVDATQNWWGSSLGPPPSGLNHVQGNILYMPWLNSRPDLSFSGATKCCSSVLFIPGIEASRLELGANRLWEPNRNLDVAKLYLKPDGTSINQNIYVNGPIDKALGIVGIYGNFMKFMDGLVARGVINEWRPFAYDWRQSIPSVVVGSQKRATTTESVIDVISAMASSSATGKVTIVAHSNGGLVTKYLVKQLASVGLASLVDRVVSVAVPYIGTPSAISALLHGDGQSILHGLIVSQKTARGLAQNMPSLYSLLPSAPYFMNLASPTVAFASTSGSAQRIFPRNVYNQSDLASFITDSLYMRPHEVSGDTDQPIVGNSGLMNAANTLHALIDTFVWPANISRLAIAGWNLATNKGIEYYVSNFCIKLVVRKYCLPPSLDHRATTTLMGDGTVVTSSAVHDAGSAVYVDLDEVSRTESSRISHANILEASTTQKILNDVIVSNSATEAVVERLSSISGVSINAPAPRVSSSLMISTHSPVELHAYDMQGRHTGLVAKPNGLENNDYIVGAYETNIPGSSFEISGDGVDRDTYIRLPSSSPDKYAVTIKGLDFGFFNFEVEQYRGDTSMGKVNYTTQPVSPIMVATTTVGGNIVGDRYIPIASTTPKLYVDIDANGTPDYLGLPGGTGLPGNAKNTDEANRLMPDIVADVLNRVTRGLKPDDSRRTMVLNKINEVKAVMRRGSFVQ